jgi:UDP-glucose 4-epimerase
MKAFVTGGAGFIGSNLVDALLARGDSVTVFDDLSTGRQRNLDGALAAGAELLTGDVRDSTAVTAAVADAAPEVVFHLAAQIDVRRSVAEPAFDADVNVGGTANLLEAARLAGASRFVFVSTGGALYGEGDGIEPPFDEGAPIAPLSPYGQSKFAAEGYLGLYERLHGLSAVSLRLANVYGPRQDPLGEAGVVAIFCQRLREGDRPTVYGDGRQTRDYIYVGDVVGAALAASTSAATGAFNVGTGIETDVIGLAERLGEIGGAGFDPKFAPARPGEVRRSALDADLAARDLDWRPQTPLADGLKLTLQSVDSD